MGGADPDPGWTTRRSGREDLLLLRVELRLSQRAGVEEFLELHQVPVRVRRRDGRLGDGQAGVLGYCGFLLRRSYRLLLGCLLLRLRGSADRSWSAAGSVVPAVGRPGC